MRAGVLRLLTLLLCLAPVAAGCAGRCPSFNVDQIGSQSGSTARSA